MANNLLPDELWNEIAELFPSYEPSPEGGRRPKEARAVLTAIVFVLKTGIGWKDRRPKPSRCRTRHAPDELPIGRQSGCGNGCTSCSWRSFAVPINSTGLGCSSIAAW